MCFVLLLSLLVIDLLAASVFLQCWVYKGNVVFWYQEKLLFFLIPIELLNFNWAIDIQCELKTGKCYY